MYTQDREKDARSAYITTQHLKTKEIFLWCLLVVLVSQGLEGAHFNNAIAFSVPLISVPCNIQLVRRNVKNLGQQDMYWSLQTYIPYAYKCMVHSSGIPLLSFFCV